MVALASVAGAGWQFFDDNGAPLAGGKIYTYLAGTTMPATTYTSNSGVVTNSNPIILDAAGRVVEEIWLTSSTSYKFVLKDANDVEIWTKDNMFGLGAESSFTGPNGSAQIGFIAGFTGAVARTVQSKLRDTVSVKDFGAVGDGVTDDTTAIQTALSSGAKEILFPTNGTYLVNGGLTLTVANTLITAYGATIKLKDNAATKWIFRTNAANTTIQGGVWDGNKTNGNSSGDPYSSFAIALYADACTVNNVNIVNIYGIGIKGFGSYNTIQNNDIKNSELYGIFFDGNTVVSHYSNHVINNNINMSEGGSDGQGILLTAGTGQYQYYAHVADNYIIGPQGASLGDQAININVRGYSAKIIGNITQFGSMGFSEGGPDATISNNQFFDIQGTVAYGIEPTGASTITGNLITGAIRGISATNTVNSYDGTVIANNVIKTRNLNQTGIQLQMGVSNTGRNIVISNNTIYANTAVVTTRDIQGITINGNKFIGSSAAAGIGVYFTAPPAALYASIIGNSMVNYLRAWVVYNATALTVTNIYIANNDTSLGVGGDTTINVETGAVIGTQCKILGISNQIRDTHDVADTLFNLTSATYTNPNTFLDGGRGSIFISRNDGSAWRKTTAKGTLTGWVAM